MQVNGNALVLGVARPGQELAPAKNKLLAVEQRHLGVGRNIQRDAPLLFACANAGFVAPVASLITELPAEEITNGKAPVPFPIVKSLEPRLFASQLLLLTAERMRIAELGEKQDGIVHAVDAEVQVIDLSEFDRNFWLLRRRIGLMGGNRKERLCGLTFLPEGRVGAGQHQQQRPAEEQLRHILSPYHPGVRSDIPQGISDSRRAAANEGRDVA